MAKPTAAACNALSTYFVEVGKKEGYNMVINRNKARWSFESMLMDYKSAEIKELIDYYYTKTTSPDLVWFSYNYDALINQREDDRVQQLERSKIRQETEQRLKDWKSKWQK